MGCEYASVFSQHFTIPQKESRKPLTDCHNTFDGLKQMRIQNPIIHLRWSVLKIFERRSILDVLNTPL